MTKLVTILARELVEWPEGFDYIRRSGNDIFFCEHSGGFTLGMQTGESDADCPGAWITKPIWQAERERLEDEEDAAVVRERKGEPTVPVWLGDGLPPIGQVIEWDDYGNMVTVEVVGHYHGSVVAVDPSVPKNVYIGKRSKYRPIKSDRDRWIEAAQRAIDGTYNASEALGALYDAGLAKMPEVE